jgi:hypothetical protein
MKVGFVARWGFRQVPDRRSFPGLISNIAQASIEEAQIYWSLINRRCSFKDGVDNGVCVRTIFGRPTLRIQV